MVYRCPLYLLFRTYLKFIRKLNYFCAHLILLQNQARFSQMEYNQRCEILKRISNTESFKIDHRLLLYYRKCQAERIQCGLSLSLKRFPHRDNVPLCGTVLLTEIQTPGLWPRDNIVNGLSEEQHANKNNLKFKTNK